MRSLVITIPIGEHQETIETLYKIGVKMKVAANQIFVDCVNGCLPEALTEIDRDFAVEVTADRSDRWDEPEIDLQNAFKNHLDSGRQRPDALILPDVYIAHLEMMG